MATPGGPVVSFTRMADGTREDSEMLADLDEEFAASTADRVLAHLRKLSGSLAGYRTAPAPASRIRKSRRVGSL